jgi:methylenetetrahydrofolate dehydrogenase (NADP+)/methenyltetrahydrofolate cyclohydrolase
LKGIIMILLDGKKISNQIKENLKSQIAELVKSGKNVPGLAAILVGDNPASQIYVSSKSKSCQEIGMRSIIEKINSDVSQENLIEIINKYNQDPNYHGILVQLPLPQHIDEDLIIETISPKKDVDGFHPISFGNLVIGKDTFIPCTPAGIQELFKHYMIPTQGKHLVVVGRSNIVGKPIANLMLQKNQYANSIVTVCHSAADDLSYYTKQADILIAAIGKPLFIKSDMVKDGVVVIDVGINRIEDSSNPKGYKIVGDVDFDEVSKKASYITPVPGGVGPMTIAMLLSNTFKAYKLYGG